MHAILKYVPDAVFIQSESSEYVHPSTPKMMKQANFLNERRFIPLDLTYAKNVSAEVYRYLMENGMKPSRNTIFS